MKFFYIQVFLRRIFELRIFKLQLLFIAFFFTVSILLLNRPISAEVIILRGGMRLEVEKILEYNRAYLLVLLNGEKKQISKDQILRISLKGVKKKHSFLDRIFAIEKCSLYSLLVPGGGHLCRGNNLIGSGMIFGWGVLLAFLMMNWVMNWRSRNIPKRKLQRAFLLIFLLVYYVLCVMDFSWSEGGFFWDAKDQVSAVKHAKSSGESG